MPPDFFQCDAQELAVALLGKVLRHRVGANVLSALIVETEAYYQVEAASHSSQGRTPSREAMFGPAGTIYMYYARGGDSLNICCAGEGDAVLIKAAVPWLDATAGAGALAEMQRRNPLPGPRRRSTHRLCAGQTLLCRAMGLRVTAWNGRCFVPGLFELEDVGDVPAQVIRARRLGIPPGRDDHLEYRFIHGGHVRSCTRNPLTRRGARPGIDYQVMDAARAAGPPPGSLGRRLVFDYTSSPESG